MKKNYSKIYLALIATGVVFGAENALAAGCENQTINLADPVSYYPNYRTAAVTPVSGDKIAGCKINTSGDHYHGIEIEGTQDVVIENTNSTTTGNEKADAIHAKNSSFTVTNSELSSKGNVTSDAIFGENLVFSVLNSHLKTEGNGDTDAIHVDHSTFDIKDSELTTIGNNDTNAIAMYSSKAVLNNVKLSSSGNNTILINGVDSELRGTNVSGEIAQKSSSLFINTGNNTFEFTDSTLVSAGFGILAAKTVSSDEDEDESTRFSDTSSTFNLTLNNSILTTTEDLIKLDEKFAYDTPPDSSDIRFVKNKNTVNIALVNNALLTGGNFTSNDDLTTNFAINNARWQVIQPVSVTHLALNQGNVELAKTDNFQTFTILGDLTGSGTFVMNTDLASEQGDKIVVLGNDSGNFDLDIQDSGNEPSSENGKVTLVETQSGQAIFGLKNRNFVDAGAFRYRLMQDGNNWVLSNRNGERVNESNTTPVTPAEPTTAMNSTTPITPTTQTNPTIPVVPVVPVVPTTPNAPNRGLATLSERTNALISLRQAQLLQVEQSLVGIHQRLGELKTDAQNNVWVRYTNSRQKLTALSAGENSQTSGFKQDYQGMQLGADTALTSNVRLGGFVGTARSDVDFNGEYGSGKIRSQQFGGYVAYLADNGFYWDNIYKYERLSSESATSDKQHFNANTVSTEIGRLHRLGSWTITPQLQAAWTHISGKANVASLTAFYGRVGVRVSNGINIGDWGLQPYTEINGVASKNNNAHISVNQYRFDTASSNSRLETALGLTAAIGNHRFGLEGKISNGKRLDQPFAVQASYRFSW